MTQAYNLSQLANNLNTAGQLDAADGLVNAVPVANGGTGASTADAARTNLNVPTRTGGDASGDWNIRSAGVKTTNFTVEQSGSDLVFFYNGTRIAKISSTGAITSASDIQAGGTV